jgi:hypothetical protein
MMLLSYLFSLVWGWEEVEEVDSRRHFHRSPADPVVVDAVAIVADTVADVAAAVAADGGEEDRQSQRSRQYLRYTISLNMHM